MDEYWKKNTHIPAFGNWDFANELPITRYFECATQARLVRYTSSSAQVSQHGYHNKPRSFRIQNKQETRNKEPRCRHGNANRREIYGAKQRRKPIRISKQMQQHHTVPPTRKPVDEDLYRIPPELLNTNNKPKKMKRFISKCLVLLVCHEQC